MARRDDDDDDAMAGGEGKRSRAERREQSEARLAMEINTGKNKCDRDSEMCVLCLSIRCTQIFKSRDGHFRGIITTSRPTCRSARDDVFFLRAEFLCASWKRAGGKVRHSSREEKSGCCMAVAFTVHRRTQDY